MRNEPHVQPQAVVCEPRSSDTSCNAPWPMKGWWRHHQSDTASAQVIQCNTAQNHQAEAVIRKYNTSIECTSLKVLIKDTTCLSLNNVQYTNLSNTWHLSANTRVYTDPNKYNISNMENKYRPDVISHLQCHSCAHYPCILTSVLYLTRPDGTLANGRKSGPNQE